MTEEEIEVRALRRVYDALREELAMGPPAGLGTERMWAVGWSQGINKAIDVVLRCGLGADT